MFGTKSNVKYSVLDKSEEVCLTEETVDLEPMKRKFCTPSCLWSAGFTGALISTYFVPSVGLTFYQRWLMDKYHYPLLIVLVHMIVKFLLAGSVKLCLNKKQKPAKVAVSWEEYLLGVATTGIFGGVDIAFSQWGLHLMTIPLYTMTKTSSIVFILFFAVLFKLEKKSWSLCGIVLMIAVGLLLFTYKSTRFDFVGFIVLLIASMSSGLRWTCVQLLLQKSKLGMDSPIDMIYHMQPWMIVSILPLAVSIEGITVIQNCQANGFMNMHELSVLTQEVLLGAFIAFFMELSEVTLVTYTSSLTLSIVGIFKDFFTISLSVHKDGEMISPINGVGLFICLCGISGHVIHKFRSASEARRGTRLYEHSNERYELGESLIEDVKEESEDTKSDTEVLFDILSREKRYSF